MSRVCKKLRERGERLCEYTALEFFARQGDWQTQSYRHLVKELHAWEIDSIHETSLRINLPHANIRIGDSFEIAHEPQYLHLFNFLVLDNPQMIYGIYCEHFEALNLAPILMANDGVVIFNVNKNPFEYDRQPEWQYRRSTYYEIDAAQLTSKFLLNFYEAKFEKLGFNVHYIFEEQRNKDYLSYIVARLSRINKV